MFGVFNQVTHKPGCTVTENGFKLEILDLEIIVLFRQQKTKMLSTAEPRCEKTGLRGFRPGPTQTGLYSHRRWLEQCSRKLQRPYRTFGQTESESLPDRSNFYLTELLSAHFNPKISSEHRSCVGKVSI